MGHPQGAKFTVQMKEAEVVMGNGERRMASKEGGPVTVAVTWARRGTGAEESAMCFLGFRTPHSHNLPTTNYCYPMCSTVTFTSFPNPA